MQPHPALLAKTLALRLAKTLALTLTLAACGGGGSSSGGTPAGPGAGSATGLQLNQRIEFAGVERSFHLYVPRQATNAPIVLLFHGFGDSSDGLLGLDGKPSPYAIWLEIAERENLIVAVPNGHRTASEQGWNDCRSDATGNSRQDDVGFVRRLVDTLVSRYQASPRHVYATGTSNGGHFSLRLGLEMGDRLAAFAAIAAANAANSQCAPSGVAVSALFMNGTADPLLPFAGGQMAGGRGLVHSAADTVADWVGRNGTGTVPVSSAIPDNPSVVDNSTVARLAYRNGRDGSEVVLYRVAGGGHNEPSIRIAKPNPAGNQNRDLEMAEAVWAFFKDKARPNR